MPLVCHFKIWQDWYTHGPYELRMTMYDHTYKICTGPNRTKSKNCETGVDTNFSPLTKNLFSIVTYWERENEFSIIEYHKVYQPHSMAGSWPRRSWLTQNGFLGCFLWMFCFIFGIFGHAAFFSVSFPFLSLFNLLVLILFWLVLLFFFLGVFLRNRVEHEVG